MARYRKVDPRIWNDSKFMSMHDNSKLVFFFLLTHPHMTAIGAMRASIPGLAAEIGWKEEAFRKAFTEPLYKGMVLHDEKACFVALPKFIKYNQPESPNVVKAWKECLDLLPECHLLNTFLSQIIKYIEGFNKAFAEALPEAFSKALAKTMPNQEQEQEQEQEQDKSVRGKPSAFAPPTLEQVSEYCLERKNSVDPQRWHDHYTSNGWLVGKAKAKMKDWKAAVRTWEGNGYNGNGNQPRSKRDEANSTRSKWARELLDAENSNPGDEGVVNQIQGPPAG